MRILLCLHTPRFARYYDDVLDELAERGHEVTIALGRPDLGAEVLATVAPALPVVERPRRTDIFGSSALGVRWAIDYVHYLDRDSSMPSSYGIAPGPTRLLTKRLGIAAP